MIARIGAATAAGPHRVDIERRQIVTPLTERPVPDLSLHRRTDADLDHPARIDQSLLDGVIKHRAVGVISGRNFRAMCRRARRNAPAPIRPRRVAPVRAAAARLSRARRPAPPDVKSFRPASRSAARLSGMSPSAIAKSPISARSQRRRIDPERPDGRHRPACGSRGGSPAGPSRVPARLVVPISNGMPATVNAASRPAREIPRKPGGVAKVGVPAIFNSRQLGDMASPMATPGFGRWSVWSKAFTAGTEGLSSWRGAHPVPRRTRDNGEERPRHPKRHAKAALTM